MQIEKEIYTMQMKMQDELYIRQYQGRRKKKDRHKVFLKLLKCIRRREQPEKKEQPSGKNRKRFSILKGLVFSRCQVLYT